MKKETFVNLITALIDQNNEDRYKAEKLEEIFRLEERINLDNKLIDVVLNSILEEFDVADDDHKTDIAIDVVFGDILAFKYEGEIYEATIDNLYEIFNK